VLSINSTIDIGEFPCTWGTAGVVGAIIVGLPPGSQIAIRDVEAAYRSVPLRPEEWAGAVIRLPGEDRLAIDTSAMFGNTGAGGVYGGAADAGAHQQKNGSHYRLIYLAGFPYLPGHPPLYMDRHSRR
jgi:hypothetical protein